MFYMFPPRTLNPPEKINTEFDIVQKEDRRHIVFRLQCCNVDEIGRAKKSNYPYEMPFIYDRIPF